jgi:acyl-CoA oxidase
MELREYLDGPADDLVDVFGVPGAVVDVPMVVPSQHE